MLCRWIQLEPILQQSITSNTPTHSKRRLGTPGRYPIHYRNKIEDQLYERISHHRRECTSIRYSDIQQKMLSLIPSTSTFKHLMDGSMDL